MKLFHVAVMWIICVLAVIYLLRITNLLAVFLLNYLAVIVLNYLVVFVLNYLSVFVISALNLILLLRFAST